MTATEYKSYELVRERHGNALRWHVYDQTGHRLTRLGFKAKADAKRFCCDRDLLRLGRRAA